MHRLASLSSPCRLPGIVTASRGACTPSHAVATSSAGTSGSGAPAGARSEFLGPIGHFLTGTASGLARGALGWIVGWVDRAAADGLRITVSIVSSTTAPGLESTWFSAVYWRMAAVSALLALPFLFAAAVHAVIRADPTLAWRAAFGYLPLAFLAIAIAAPLTTLLLSATDELCGFLAATSNHADTTFLSHAAGVLGAESVVGADPFLAFFIGLITVAATVSLWVELLIRAAAVEVIVLMLPLFFAAMVWPARRVWAVRAIETLIALVLAKFAIVAVLTLGGIAIIDPTGPASMLTGATLILLSVATPWALLRLLPLHELAAAAASGLSQAPRAVPGAIGRTLLGGSAPDDGSSDEDDGGRGDGGGGGDGGDDDAAYREWLARLPRGPRGGGPPEPTVSPERSAEAERAIADAELGPALAAIGTGGRGGGGTIASGSGEGAGATMAFAGTATGGDDGDPRGPLPAEFRAGSTWEGYVIGEDGAETMLPPRIARAGGEDPDDAGSPAGGWPPEAEPEDAEPPPVLDSPSVDLGIRRWPARERERDGLEPPDLGLER